jgi:hypothetical protein
VGSYRAIPLSVVRVAVAAARPASTSQPAAPPPELLAAEEVPRSVVVSAIPAADASATEAAILGCFGSFGDIARLIFQDDAASGTAHQRAVIVYATPGAAANAVAASGLPLLGAPVEVVLASSLPPMAALPVGGGGGGAGGGMPLITPDAVAGVAHLLAQGFLAGERGLASVRRYGAEQAPHTLERIQVVAADAATTVSGINERYRIVPRAAAVVNSAVDAATRIDREYRLSERGGELATSALERGRALLAQNPTAAKVVHSAADFLGQAVAAVNSAVGMARQEVISATSARRSVSPPAAAVNLPAGHPGAAAAAAPETAAAAPAPAAAAASSSPPPPSRVEEPLI